MTPSLYRQSILEITVFTCGALVMVFEIIGSRILSPFIGTSTYVWTSLIGVILAALSLGYWLGGRLADRRPDVKLLAIAIFIAGSLVGLTVLIKDILLSMIASAPVGLELKSIIAALLLFAPASVCLGVVTPFAVRLKMTSVETTGSTVGRLYPLSTVGSIIGTFSAGFFLIPFVGSVRTLYVIAGLLMLLAFALGPLAISRTTISGVVVLLFGITATELNAYVMLERSGLHDIDTEYSRVQVFETTDSATNRPMRAIATDPYFVQSAMYLDGDDLALKYSHFYHLMRHYRPGFKRTLVIGGAGYSFPKEHLRTYPDAQIDVVEIDAQMTEIARNFFNLRDDPRLRIIHEDARMLINRLPENQYDVILMDAFGSLFSVPSHLTTIEAVTHLNRILTDDGVVIFNLGSAITGPASGFLHAELATYQQVFPYVHVFKVNPDYTDQKMQNLIIVAAKSATSPQSTDPKISQLLTHAHPITLIPNTQILTDDLAPTDHQTATAQNHYLKNR